jgi:hypothetical protein
VVEGEEMDDAQKLTLKSFLQEQPDWCFDLVASVQYSEELEGTFSGRTVGNRLQRPGRSLVPLMGLGVLAKTGHRTVAQRFLQIGESPIKLAERTGFEPKMPSA